MKVSSIIIILVIVGAVGAVGLAFMGIIEIPGIGLSKKNLTKVMDEGLEAAQGYTAAKTPKDAVQMFYNAVQHRKYDTAAKYCVKGVYSDGLERANSAAYELGTSIDGIYSYAKEQGLLSDRSMYFLHYLDPFPKNIKIAKPVEQKDGKEWGFFSLEPISLKDGIKLKKDIDGYKELDPRMYKTVLAEPIRAAMAPNTTTAAIELVKQGEEWKLNVIATPAWEIEVTYFIDRYKPYATAVEGFRIYMHNEKYSLSGPFEEELTGKLRAIK